MEKRHNYVRKVAEVATQLYITNDKPNIAGLILAGSADFKTELSQSDMFDPVSEISFLSILFFIFLRLFFWRLNRQIGYFSIYVFFSVQNCDSSFRKRQYVIFFFQRLQAKVIKLVDVSYGGENGFNQAIELAAESLQNVKFIQEKKLIGK